jgi:threonine dehydratase
MNTPLPDLADIEHAAAALAPLIVRTPLLESPILNEALDARILFKAEALQRTGSFKFRGAWTAISRMSPGQRQAGVVAFSSGNHAQGVAAAARLHAIPAVIVMPSSAPRIKIGKTRQLGAEVVLYDPETEDRDAIGERLRDAHGYALVRPFDDFDVICGQGTVGLEIDEQLAALGVDADELWCPCGGGGLIGGISTALAARRPRLRPFCVEPEHFDDTRRSLAAGERCANPPGHHSICDALLAPRPGELTFAVNRERVAGGLVATEAQVKGAMRWAFEELGVVLEPGGAVAVAAVLSRARELRGRTIVAVCSGGNVDAERFADCITSTGDPFARA